MVERLNLNALIKVLHELTQLSDKGDFASNVLGQGHGDVPLEAYERVCAALDKAVDACAVTPGFADAHRKISSIASYVKSSRHRMNSSALSGEIFHAVDALARDASRGECVIVPAERVTYIENPRLFGEAVTTKFPAAVYDITEAGNCFAVGCYTASVFHLMRVAEHGLRELAKRLRVTLTNKKKPMPIEYANWSEVIDGIRKKIAEARTLPRGPKREERLQFYSDLAEQCEYLKDVWRNNVSHTRLTYNYPEALVVMQRVSDLMAKLATGVR